MHKINQRKLFLWFLKSNQINRYACLVAVKPSPGLQDLVGIVDVTVFRDAEVLQYLTGADEYLYVSGIAVLRNFRYTNKSSTQKCQMI